MILQNAFWTVKPIDRFNIYDALVADELHQLMGVYSHILECVEKMVLESTDDNGANIGLNIKKTINDR